MLRFTLTKTQMSVVMSQLNAERSLRLNPIPSSAAQPNSRFGQYGTSKERTMSNVLPIVDAFSGQLG